MIGHQPMGSWALALVGCLAGVSVGCARQADSPADDGTAGAGGAGAGGAGAGGEGGVGGEGGSAGNGQTDARATDARPPLRVEFTWTTFCPPESNVGCGDERNTLIGEAGARSQTAGTTIGLACEVITGAAPEIALLQVQNQPLEVAGTEGIKLSHATFSAGTEATCASDAFVLIDQSRYTGGCAGVTPRNCAVLVKEHDPSLGRLVLSIECKLLGGSKDIYDGRLTVEGCSDRL